MNKLTITLKQHTPLLHFQPMQEGATLRASEVKPKLDKFLIEKLGGKDNVPKDWRLPNPDPNVCALNYKMRISAGEQKPEYYMVASYIKRDNIEALQRQGINVLANTSYFAQEKQNGQIGKAVQNRDSRRVESLWKDLPVKGVKYTGPLELTILSKNEELVRYIATYTQLFFLVNNFGTRQTKGFGSFTVEVISVNDKETVSVLNNEDLLKEHCKCLLKRQIKIGFPTVFQTINSDYSLLKRGQTRPYSNSILMTYAKEELGFRWEKRFIKREFEGQFCDENDYEYVLKSNHKKRPTYSSSEKYRYVRAILGLSEQFEFLLEGTKDKLVVKIKSNDIERFASPLTFKIINNEVYIIVNEIPKELLDATFSFLVNFKEDKAYENEPLGDGLKTLKEFSLIGFMRYACKNKDFNYNIL